MDFEKIAAQVLMPQVKAIEIIMGEITEPLKALQNPETLMGKPYESWTEEEVQLLSTIYGPGDNPLNRLIMKKKYEKILTLESEVG